VDGVTPTLRQCAAITDATKPTLAQRRLFWVLHLRHVPWPDGMNNLDDRREWQRTILLEGMVPALGFEPLTSRSQIARPLMHALLDVLSAMDKGEAVWDGTTFLTVGGEPWTQRGTDDSYGF